MTTLVTAPDSVVHGPLDMTARWVFVTPEIAGRWLERNTHNRVIKKSAKARYARAMVSHEWMPTSVLAFSPEGVLIDGQNRLLAVVETGEAQWFLVIEGAPEIAQDVMDTGVRRSLADQLHMRGEKMASELGAAVTQVWTYRQKGYFGPGSTGGPQSPSTLECLRLLDEIPGIRGSVQATYRVARQFKIGSGVAACAHLLFSELDPQDADYFWERLEDGEGLSRANPILTLRNDLGRDAVALRGMKPIRKAAIVVRSWNAFRDGEELTKLQWSPGGSRPDRFPIPR